MAAPSFGATPVFSTATGSPFVVSRPACSDGDLLVMQVSSLGSTTWATPSGWTKIVDTGINIFGTNAARAYVFTRVAASEPSTYSLSSPTTLHDAMVSVVSGVDTTTPIDVSATSTLGANTSTPQAPTVTTTKNDTLLLHLWWMWGPASTTAGAGETKQYEHAAETGGADHAGMIVMTTIAKSTAGATGASTLTTNTNTFTGTVTATLAAAPLATPAAPVADFTGTPLSGTTPLSVAFTDSSTNTPTSWAWTFGDGGTSTSQNPSHSYTTPGTYTVALVATNAGGSNTKTRTGYVTVNYPSGSFSTVKFGTALTVTDEGAGVIRVDSTVTTGPTGPAGPTGPTGPTGPAGATGAPGTPAPTVAYGTSLPGSPTDGLEAILVDSTTAPTYQWRFRYNAGSSSAYKWEFIGGAPIRADVAAEETTTSGSYVELTTHQRITVPRAGDYDLVYGCGACNNSAVGGNVQMDVTESSSFFGTASVVAASANFSMVLARTSRATGRPAAATLTVVYLASGGTARFSNRYFEVRPVRVS